MWKIMKQRSVSLEDDFPVNSTEKRSHHDSHRVTVPLSTLVPNCDMEDNETRDEDQNTVINKKDKSERTFVGESVYAPKFQWQGQQGCAIVLRYMQYSDPTTHQDGLDNICAQWQKQPQYYYYCIRAMLSEIEIQVIIICLSQMLEWQPRARATEHRVQVPELAK